MRLVHLMIVALGAGAFGVVTACNDSGGPAGVSLVGDYTLVALAVGPFPAPGSTGTLSFTSTTVNATLNVISPNTGVIHDTTLVLSGSYTTSAFGFGDSIHLALGPPIGTIGGTYVVSGTSRDTLSLSFTALSVPFGTIWHKN